MSYCRWSTDDFGCDLYCFEDVLGGWTTYVAGHRPVGSIPKVTASFDEPEEMARQMRAQSQWLDTCERKPIGLPHDGKRFFDTTLENFRERLLSLRALGYRFPDAVLDQVDFEIAEEARANG